MAKDPCQSGLGCSVDSIISLISPMSLQFLQLVVHRVYTIFTSSIAQTPSLIGHNPVMIMAESFGQAYTIEWYSRFSRHFFLCLLPILLNSHPLGGLRRYSLGRTTMVPGTLELAESPAVPWWLRTTKTTKRQQFDYYLRKQPQDNLTNRFLYDLCHLCCPFFKILPRYICWCVRLDFCVLTFKVLKEGFETWLIQMLVDQIW